MSTKNAKKVRFFLSSLLALLLICLSLTACTPIDGGDDDGEPVILTSTFPVYDWARNILDGVPVRLELLNTKGGDMHGYDPSYADIVRMKSATLFICIGGESEKWTEDVFTSADNRVLSLMGTPDLKLIETDSVGDDEHHDDDCSHSHDEHIWLSLRSAVTCVGAMARELIALLPEYKDAIEAGCENYVSKLVSLDGEFESAVNASDTKSVIFADRYPFVYMMHDYGIKCTSAFGGCSTDTNASFESIVSLAKALNEQTVDVLLVCDGSDKSIANSVISASQKKNAEILILDSMQSIGSEYESADYISIMQQNLSVLGSALGSSGTN
jgi:zinc transport system substrate-binding protein